ALIWIGGLAIIAAAVAGVSAAVGTLAVPELTVFGAVTVGLFSGLVLWIGLSVIWSIEGDRTWNYVNRALVYLAFLTLGLAVGRMRRAPRLAGAGVAGGTAAAVRGALPAQNLPALAGPAPRAP